MTDPEDSPAALPENEEDEDCYWDGPYLVFTEAFHRKRGYCCNSGCRHCPWRQDSESARSSPPPGS